MAPKSKARKLADELLALSSPAPTDWDPESLPDVDGTAAAGRQGPDSDSDGDAFDSRALSRSSLRRAQDEISLTEGAYRGRAVPRSAVLPESESDSDVPAEVERAWAPDLASSSGSDVGELDEGSSEEEEESDGDGDGGGLGARGARVGEELKLLAFQDASQERGRQRDRADGLQRSQHVRNQKVLWGHFLETRIRLQKLLNAGNKLPPAGEAPRQAPELRALLGSLLDVQAELQPRLAGAAGTSAATGRKRPRADATTAPLDQLWESMQSDWQAGAALRAEAIDKWQAKTQAASLVQTKKFKTLNQGVLAQVAQVVADDRVVANKAHPRLSTDVRGPDAAAELDYEVYDDSTFYQQLLRELIESGGASGKDLPKDAGKIKLKRTKKACDPKASKGRRIRYEPHAKLLNFTFPVPMPEPAMDVGELYKSLFR